MPDDIIAEIAELHNRLDWLDKVIDKRTEDCQTANARISILEVMIEELCRDMDFDDLVQRVRRLA